jgi:adenine-specific DNA-methyltransferase
MAAARATRSVGVETYKQDETRTDIPTEERREFAADVEETEKLVWPRNPDLDPQLAWKARTSRIARSSSAPPIGRGSKPRAVVDSMESCLRAHTLRSDSMCI